MQLQVIENSAATVKLAKNLKKDKDRKYDLNFHVDYSDIEKSTFKLVFNLKLISPKKFRLDVEYITTFLCDQEIDDDFKNSHFPAVNAPAIAYPFLRSYVSFLTLNSGYESVILPSINFTSFRKKETPQK